jgi:hypothetical protein
MYDYHFSPVSGTGAAYKDLLLFIHRNQFRMMIEMIQRNNLLGGDEEEEEEQEQEQEQEEEEQED